jgi:hypothetical protein
MCWEARAFSGRNLKFLECFNKLMASNGTAEVLCLKAAKKLSQCKKWNVLFEKWFSWLTFG